MKNLEYINLPSNLELFAKQAVEGFITGMHKSPYHGFSVEFAEHRLYNTGESTKHIDWKLMAKTDKLYIKQFEEETNLKCYILFDKSTSMKYASKNISKFEYSKTVCAALSYLMIKQQDAVGLTLFDKKINKSVSPRSNKSHLNVLLNMSIFLLRSLLLISKPNKMSLMSLVKVLKAMRLLKVMMVIKVMMVMTQKMVNLVMLMAVMPMMEMLMMKLLKANQAQLAKVTLKTKLLLVEKLVKLTP